MKKLDNFLSFLDNHLNGMLFVTVALTTISEIMFNFVHTPVFGYTNATTEENLRSSMLTLCLIIPFITSQKWIIKGLGKRNATYLNLIIFGGVFFDFLSNFYCMFIGDIPMIIVFSIYIPLFILMAVFIYRIKDVLKEAIDIIISNIKLYINLGKK